MAPWNSLPFPFFLGGGGGFFRARSNFRQGLFHGCHDLFHASQGHQDGAGLKPISDLLEAKGIPEDWLVWVFFFFGGKGYWWRVWRWEGGTIFFGVWWEMDGTMRWRWRMILYLIRAWWGLHLPDVYVLYIGARPIPVTVGKQSSLFGRTPFNVWLYIYYIIYNMYCSYAREWLRVTVKWNMNMMDGWWIIYGPRNSPSQSSRLFQKSVLKNMAPVCKVFLFTLLVGHLEGWTLRVAFTTSVF